LYYEGFNKSYFKFLQTMLSGYLYGLASTTTIISPVFSVELLV
jgi:hypothetical protein